MKKIDFMKNKLKFMLMAVVAVLMSFVTVSCGDDGDDNSDGNMPYQLITVNGEQYACYGYSSYVTYSSSKSYIQVPYGLLSDAKAGAYNYDNMLMVRLKTPISGNGALTVESVSAAITKPRDT